MRKTITIYTQRYAAAAAAAQKQNDDVFKIYIKSDQYNWNGQLFATKIEKIPTTTTTATAPTTVFTFKTIVKTKFTIVIRRWL